MRTKKKKTSQGKPSVGFTLVEMLVAVALVLLMMSLFAQVFQLAGGTITTQRGIAENDQRSRTFQNVIKADLDKRTFRVMMPWSVGEDGGLAEVDAIKREGYFYISENDPLNDLDDQLQFTMNVNAISKNNDLSPFFGKATTGADWVSSTASGDNYLNFVNQPEADDGWTRPNDTAEATAAEVSYFVRGGKLYRRTLLIRKALPVGSRTDGQPTFNDGRNAFDYTIPVPPMPPGSPSPYPDPTTVVPPNVFWNDFDHSAYPQPGRDAADPIATFHSLDDLSNSSTQTLFPLGRPNFRFGHQTGNGRSREFDSSQNYFGRFTHEETSSENFRYPHGLSTLGNPMTATINLDVDPNTNPLTDNTFPTFAFGPRRGEDLLLSNVHGFDVKVWDAGALGGAGAFVDIGRLAADADVYSPFAVDYALTTPFPRLNGLYGPTTTPADNRVFDTWYPFANGTFPAGDPNRATRLLMDLNTDDRNDDPPFRSVIRLRGTGANQYPAYDDTSTSYTTGTSVFPNNYQRGNGLRFSYRCVQVVGMPGAQPEPTLQQWPAVAGGRIQVPDNSTTNYYVWEAVDNWKPLRAIQITVRFYDVTSEQMRQQTIVHSLVD